MPIDTFREQNTLIFTIKGFRTFVFIFIVISTTAMANGNRTSDLGGFNKRRSSMFRVSSRVRQPPAEVRRIYRPKRCVNNNKDKDNSPKTLNDKNHQASSQKFRQNTMTFFTAHRSLFSPEILFPLYGLSFWLKLFRKYMFNRLVHLFYWIILLYTYHTFFCKFHIVWTSQLQKICWQTSV